MPKTRHWVAIPLALFAAAVALGLFAVHTTALTAHDLQLDRNIQTTFRSSSLNTVMLDLADVFSPVAGLVMLAVISGVLLYLRKPVQAASTFLVVAVGWNSSEIAKIIVARHRPPVQFSLAPETGSNSFPSGHVALAVSLAMAMFFLARGTRWELPVAIAGGAWTLLIAFDRLYIGAHYPTDVFGSIIVSIAAVYFLTGLWHGWIEARLYKVPLLDRFGTLPTPTPTGDGAARPGAATDARNNSTVSDRY